MPPAADEFQTLVDAHYQGLYWFALGLSHNATDASDLVQQTFFRWARKAGPLRRPEGAKSWLFRTLYREFLRHRRRSLREEPLPPDELPEPPLTDPAVESIDHPAVLAAIEKLPADHRAVVTMFYLRHFSYQEIADVLEVPIGTVMSRLSRAKSALRRQLLPAPAADGAAAPPAGPSVSDVIPFPRAQNG